REAVTAALASDDHTDARRGLRLGQRLQRVALGAAVTDDDDAGSLIRLGPVILELERMERAHAVAEVAGLAEQELGDQRRVPRGADATEHHALHRFQARSRAGEGVLVAAHE